jgi:lysophospholipase L1-like esterase
LNCALFANDSTEQSQGEGTMKQIHSFLPLCLLAAAFIGGAASAEQRGEHRDEMLVLGDSVAFGYIASAGYEYVNPDNFVGFPLYLDHALGLEAVDAACPGETTGSFLSASLPDLGCQVFRKHSPLHVLYSSTQLEFAKRFLKSHRNVRLVTVTLGSNDGFLLEASCNSDPGCILAGLPAISANIAKILADLRATGYGGAIVLTNYYSIDYTDVPFTELTAALNDAIAAPAAAYGAVVADVFTVFQQAAAPFLNSLGNNTCQAGLLNVANPIAAAPPFDCDIHPSQSGHQLVAEAVLRALRGAERY